MVLGPGLSKEPAGVHVNNYLKITFNKLLEKCSRPGFRSMPGSKI